jgi:hypothetical protein
MCLCELLRMRQAALVYVQCGTEIGARTHITHALLQKKRKAHESSIISVLV